MCGDYASALLRRIARREEGADDRIPCIQIVGVAAALHRDMKSLIAKGHIYIGLLPVMVIEIECSSVIVIEGEVL